MKKVFLIALAGTMMFACKKNESEKTARYMDIAGADYITYTTTSNYILKSETEGGSAIYKVNIFGSLFKTQIVNFLDENHNPIDDVAIEVEKSLEIDNFIWFYGTFNVKTDNSSIAMTSFLLNKETGEIYDTQGDYPSVYSYGSDRNFDIQKDKYGNIYFATTNNGYLYTLKKLSVSDNVISISEIADEHTFQTKWFCVTPEGDCIFSNLSLGDPYKVVLANGELTEIEQPFPLQEYFVAGNVLCVNNEGYYHISEIRDGKFVVEELPASESGRVYRKYTINCEIGEFKSYNNVCTVGSVTEIGINDIEYVLTLPENMKYGNFSIIGRNDKILLVENSEKTVVYQFSLEDYSVVQRVGGLNIAVLQVKEEYQVQP